MAETPDATEAAQKHAEATGVDLSQVAGSGAEGRITKADVEAAVAQEAVDETNPEPVEVRLANGSVIEDETPLRCGKCGATFFAKDAPDGSCPAEGIDQSGAHIVCGGVLGPIQA